MVAIGGEVEGLSCETKCMLKCGGIWYFARPCINKCVFDECYIPNPPPTSITTVTISSSIFLQKLNFRKKNNLFIYYLWLLFRLCLCLYLFLNNVSINYFFKYNIEAKRLLNFINIFQKFKTMFWNIKMIFQLANTKMNSFFSFEITILLYTYIYIYFIVLSL